ncbi:MAG: hypothetical protein ACE10M_10035, partial [Alphaproteobacteria bacterium]
MAKYTQTFRQVPDAFGFRGAEGIALHDGKVYFTTKHDNRVWSYDTDSQLLEIVYDVATTAVAGNKILLARMRGDREIPADWARDERG